MPANHMGVLNQLPATHPSSFLPIQTLESRVMTQVAECLLPMWETRIAFLAPGFGLTEILVFQAF